MARGKIYLREQDGLVPLSEAAYDAESILQKLLADYPDLLAGDQMRPAEPRRWLLISREAGVPDKEAGYARRSIDHLFIDQDAVPTLVEVKRSSNTQIRREIVGQMLDYAANIVAYWPASQLRQLFEDRPRPDGSDPDREVLALLGATASSEEQAARAVDGFWERAADNLAARHVRLVFVADAIPAELQRIVEFLNESMARAEVLAVEVKQYRGQGRETFVRFASVSAQGYVTVNYVSLAPLPPFDRAEERLELNRRLNTIPGTKLREKTAVEATWPSLSPHAVEPATAQDQVFNVFDWVADRLATGR